MAETAITIPDYLVLVEPLPLRELAGLTDELLTEHRDLPAPGYFSVSQAGQEISLQFPDSPATFKAMAQWAERFGGTLTGQPHTCSDGRPSIHCEVKFIHRRANVRLYAYVSADQASTATT